MIIHVHNLTISSLHAACTLGGRPNGLTASPPLFAITVYLSHHEQTKCHSKKERRKSTNTWKTCPTNGACQEFNTINLLITKCTSDQSSFFIINVYLQMLSYFNEIIYFIFLNRYALLLPQRKQSYSSQTSIINKDRQSTI